jgi:glycosyltransferase involved in cell wall biosynthesis
MVAEAELISGLLIAERSAGLTHQACHRVLVAVPAHNEERFIGSVVLTARLLGFQVLVIDDGSTDRTAELAKAAGAFVERHPTNRGKAEALNTAFQVARQERAEALVVLDGDGQHSVAELEPFVEVVSSGQADIVIGSRFLPQANGEVPAVRRFGQRALTLLTNISSGVAVTDSQSGFRAFSRRAIEALSFYSSGFAVEVEMQFLASQHGLTVREVPITALYADPPKRSLLGQGQQVLNGLLALTGRHRPLLFFCLPGLFFVVAGLLLGALVVSIYQDSHNLAVGYAQLTVLLTVMGLLSVFVGLLLHAIRGSFLELERRLAGVERAGRRRVD